MKYKLVTFDLTNTLMRFCVQPHVQYLRVAAANGVDVSNKEDFQNQFKKAFKMMDQRYPNFGNAKDCQKIHWSHWWLAVVKQSFLNSGVPDGAKLEKIAQALLELYGTTGAWVVKPDTVNLLNSLKRRGQRMGIISNIDPRIHSVLEQANLSQFFEFSLSSYEASFYKPQPEIFHVAIEKYSKFKTKPEECCHIGDSPKEDYQGAIKAGWNAILLNESRSLDVSLENWCPNLKSLDSLLQ